MKKEIKEFDTVILTEDLNDTELKAGDVGAVVHVYEEGNAFEVEFFNLNGDTLAVQTLFSHQLRLSRQKEITHARETAT